MVIAVINLLGTSAPGNSVKFMAVYSKVNLWHVIQLRTHFSQSHTQYFQYQSTMSENQLICNFLCVTDENRAHDICACTSLVLVGSLYSHVCSNIILWPYKFIVQIISICVYDLRFATSALLHSCWQGESSHVSTHNSKASFVSSARNSKHIS